MLQSENTKKASLPNQGGTLNSNIDFNECSKMADRAMEAEICISQKVSNELVTEINIDVDCPRSSDSFPTEAANEACRRCIDSGACGAQEENDACGNCQEDADCETQPVRTCNETNVHQTLRSLKESVGELNRVICSQFNSSSKEDMLMAEIRCMRTQLCELIHIVQDQTNTEGASPCSKDSGGELSKNIEDIKCQLQQLITCVSNLASKCGSDDNRSSIVSKVQTLKNCIEDAIATERGMCDDNAEVTAPLSCTEKTKPRCSSSLSQRQSQSCAQPKANCSIHKKPSLSMAKPSSSCASKRPSAKSSRGSQQRFTLSTTTNPRASSTASKCSARKSTQSGVSCQQTKSSTVSTNRPSSVMVQAGSSCTQTRTSSLKPSDTQSIRESVPRCTLSEARGNETCTPRPIELLCDSSPKCSAVVMVDEPKVSCPTVEEPRDSGSLYNECPRASEITIPSAAGSLSRTQSCLQPDLQPRSTALTMNSQMSILEPRLTATASYFQPEEDVCSGAALMTPESLCEKVESIISSSMAEDVCDTEPRRPSSFSLGRASSTLQPRASCESEPRMSQNAYGESMERILMILQNLEGIVTEIGCQDRAVDLIASMKDLLVNEFGQGGGSDEPDYPCAIEARPSVEEFSCARNSVVSSDREPAATLNTQIKQVLCNLHSELQTYLGETKDEILDMLDEIALLLEELENCDNTENLQADEPCVQMPDDLSDGQCGDSRADILATPTLRSLVTQMHDVLADLQGCRRLSEQEYGTDVSYVLDKLKAILRQECIPTTRLVDTGRILLSMEEELTNQGVSDSVQAEIIRQISNFLQASGVEMPRQSMGQCSQMRSSSRGPSSYDGKILEIVDDIEDLIRQSVATCSSNKDNPDCHLASAEDLAYAEDLMRASSSENEEEGGENPRLTMNAKVAEVLCELRGIVLTMELEGSKLNEGTMCKMVGIFDQIERILENDKQNAELLTDIRKSLNRLEKQCNPCGCNTEGNDKEGRRSSSGSGKRKSSSSRKSFMAFRRSKTEKESQTK